MSRRIERLSRYAAAPLSAMHMACFPEEPWDAAALARIMVLPGSFGFAAWEDDAPVGFLLARDLGDEVEILSVGALPEYRRQGIGAALLDAAAAEARRRQIASLVLEVAEDNGNARRLYAAQGYVQVGRRPRYYRRSTGTSDALILRCSTEARPAATAT